MFLPTPHLILSAQTHTTIPVRTDAPNRWKQAQTGTDLHPAHFHFNRHGGFPEVTGEGGAAAVVTGFVDAEFRGAADIQATGLAERLKEPIQENLRLHFFVGGEVLLAPRSAISKFFPARHGGKSARENCRRQFRRTVRASNVIPNSTPKRAKMTSTGLPNKIKRTKH